jgi:hypothetical protein
MTLKMNGGNPVFLWVGMVGLPVPGGGKINEEFP